MTVSAGSTVANGSASVAVSRVLNRLEGVKQTAPAQWSARCPAHDDRSASLSIGQGDDGRALLCCHAGCSFGLILAATGLTGSEVAPPKTERKSTSSKGRIVAEYAYRDANGKLIFQALRKQLEDGRKTFLQRQPDGGGGWTWNAKGCAVVPYRLPELLADPEPTAFVVEGEKDVESLVKLGLVATCNAGGAGKWKPEHAKYLRGRRVVVLPDNDEAGRNHRDCVVHSLRGVAESVRVVELPGLPEKGDVSDWLAGGGTREALLELVEAAEPINLEALSEPKQSKAGESDAIANAVEVVTTDAEGVESKITAYLTMPEIRSELKAATDDWPRRVGSSLFVHDPTHGVAWLDNSHATFGWLASQRRVRWFTGREAVTQAQLHAELERTAPSYDAVENVPHFPPMPRHYYTVASPNAGDGSALRKLVDRFTPSTDIDRDLIAALFATTFWGGRPGTRPAFVLTSDAGRGAGKTTLAEMVGLLAGGLLAFEPGEDIERIKQRLLSPVATGKRVALIDNVKRARFSWGELEALITTPVLSGKQLYVGEAQRPNTLTWIVTINGVSLSADMAQRAVIIKLDRAEYSSTWKEETASYIEHNRTALMADVRGLLESEPWALNQASRWGAWEEAVLCRLPEPGEAQRVILERQAACDADGDEGELIDEYVAEQLRALGYLSTAIVRIPNRILAKWFIEATGEHMKTQAVTRRINQMATEGQIRTLKPDPSRANGRCFIYTPKGADPLTQNTMNDLENRLEHPTRQHS
ncbi:toprim domain-containing protein [Botrimarina hoheduenensis]|uniref:Toprim domain-containing protein n=1 Tax=Botrimarina hoheduenensis TaxID=2528000 RepID=A0A5C5VNF4_9BACT|nr:toprim domain-containing protein [Botrimarina hoheduenensis]TWT40108.1 hypothetical protein Pla111_34370 [Botrimarina hoheduenensis]